MASDDGNRPATREGAELVKAAEKQLVATIKTKAGRDVVASFTPSAAISIYRENKTILDMSNEHATAVVEMKRLEFAVPEQERTARSIQQTTRLKYAAVVAVVGAALIYLKPEAGWPIVGVVGLLESGIAFVEVLNREKRKELPRPKKD